MNPAQNSPNSDSPSSASVVPVSAGSDANIIDGMAAENSVLNEIVRASGLEGQHAPDQQLLRAQFLQIAATYKDVEFSVNPIVMALVHSALGTLSGINDATAAQLERFVANSMCENNETHVRVRRFWDSLVKIVEESER